ncbi:MAG TPA: bifunctional ADP-dependent NAD(P)H-hydrate dehydratase/NAD(P)H-hydrate epimerase [Exilispira sp.]|nr:bifunctional ADP-dependent NAD(P)H-hydrate dehydratase/NAD(P)H-hydrate epimerase [Exilispira sp.]
MKLLSFQKISDLERYLIDDLDYKAIILMENAANSIANILIDIIKNKKIDFEPFWLNKDLQIKIDYALARFNKKDEITFLVGSGNNGGDALAVARKIFLRENYKINILFFGEGKSELRIYQEKLLKSLNLQKQLLNNLDEEKDKSIYKDNLIHEGSNLKKINFIQIEDDLIQSILSEKIEISKDIEDALNAPLLIDGITGIGLKSPLDEKLKRRIEFIERYKQKDSIVISIDLPTGCTKNSEKVLNADITLMLQWAKLEFFLVENRKYSLTYKILECDMADCNYLENLKSLKNKDENKGKYNNNNFKNNNFKNTFEKNIELIQFDDIKKILKKREFYSNKGNFGRVFIISNAPSTLGAPIIASKSAIKTGAGYVYLCLKKEYEADCKFALPYIITLPYDYDPFNSDFERVLNNNSKEFKDTVLIGSGFGLNEELFFKILTKLIDKKINILIDGDGLNIISKNFKIYFDLAKNRNSKIVFTPHKKEFERLFESFYLIFNYEEKDQLSFLEKGNLFFESKIIDGLLMKDYISYFISEKNIYCNNGCYSGFSKAGTGDFISGVFAALLSNYDIDTAAMILLALQDRLALDLSNKNIAIQSVISEDLIDQLCQSLFNLY